MAVGLSRHALGKNWLLRFINRYYYILNSAYLNAIDLARYKANTILAYKAYFDAIGKVIEEFNIIADNIYNIDKKGFLIG